MKTILTLLFFFSTPSLFAQSTTDAPCPNVKKIRGLCMYVGDKEKADIPQGRFVYKYQLKLLEAACVDIANDSEEEIGKKIRVMMKLFQDQLTCNNTRFGVGNGNLIKYAVNLKFDEFLIDMCTWKANLNKVDESDGRTVLDYIENQINKNRGLPAEKTYQRYYDMVRRADGKHKFELQ